MAVGTTAENTLGKAAKLPATVLLKIVGKVAEKAVQKTAEKAAEKVAVNTGVTKP